MSQLNPYAPPIVASTAVAGASQAGWQLNGNTLVVAKGATLPSRCLFDGSPVSVAPTTKTLTWVPPWLAVLVLLNPIIYVIAFVIAKKSGSLSYYIGDEGKRRRTAGIVMIVLSFVALILFVFIGVAADLPLLALLGLLAFLVLLIAGALRAKVFTIEKIDEQYVYIKLRDDAVRGFSQAAGY